MELGKRSGLKLKLLEAGEATLRKGNAAGCSGWLKAGARGCCCCMGGRPRTGTGVARNEGPGVGLKENWRACRGSCALSGPLGLRLSAGREGDGEGGGGGGGGVAGVVVDTANVGEVGKNGDGVEAVTGNEDGSKDVENREACVIAGTGTEEGSEGC